MNFDAASTWITLLDDARVSSRVMCERCVTLGGKKPRNQATDRLVLSLDINAWPALVRGPRWNLLLMEAVAMLVLSRRENSSIKIGSDVRVTVLSVRRQHVRLGIEAPKDVRVLRDELEKAEFEAARRTDTQEQRLVSRMKIVLVIEDDPLHAKLICKSLCSKRGTMVTVAETGKLALDALGALADAHDVVHPDLILLDMQLPDSTGLDVLRSIRKDERLRRTPVVMLTCCQEDTVVQECLESGANAFVVKSARWDDFRSSVSRIGDFWTNDYFAPPSSGSRSPSPVLSESVN